MIVDQPSRVNPVRQVFRNLHGIAGVGHDHFRIWEIFQDGGDGVDRIALAIVRGNDGGQKRHYKYRV